MILNLSELYELQSVLKSPHRTAYYQLVLIEDGDGVIVLDSQRYKYGPRTLLAVSKGRIEVNTYAAGCRGYSILFSEDFLNQNPEDIIWINGLKLFDISANPLIKNLTAREYTEILIYLKKIMAESYNLKDFAKENIIKGLLRIFILICERYKRNRVNDETINDADWYYVLEFKKKLEEYKYKSKSVHTYADLLNITSKKLNKITRDFWGKSAKDIIEERILLEIKRLLIYSDKSIKEISYMFGFSDLSNFNKFFKKNINETPARFRISNKDELIP